MKKTKCFDFQKGALYVKFRYVDPPAMLHDYMLSFAKRKDCTVEFLGEQPELPGLPTVSRISCVVLRGSITENVISLLLKNFIGEDNLIFVQYEKA